MKRVFTPLLLAVIIIACESKKPADDPMVKTAATETPAGTQAVEFADPKFMDMGKRYMTLLVAGKIDEWAEQLADNAVYLWSSGDSLTGKQAITAYWKERHAKVIEKLSFANDIWLPVKVNQPQRGPDMPGVWLMNWQQVDVTYKNGKNLKFWIHNDFHYNDAGKIDRAIQYIDRAPINAALGLK
jgi:hypothetical protein